uniref:Peptide-methionine (R)-S-oxide reductase n=1 Tax=Polyblepharides amylifera TaxID=1486889 RepID=A0A7R9SV60_9CHLO|mmetsp:Transcript_15/g.21  ORF Transcript_15/g.21 Transcript_15/m.21 type:complete len:237 (+) Transcript_15:86-796(+)|eukprot:CAMPEP_0196571476 /NCGR_PEP_ID=MMETSP1081-20130531/1648_1 /TAXON_ID=36882 /ORGANISM="Pyramimonas amylifera, Strain CCMP720" /LENGTH=236 /DNA_ID=CAMNT_0041888439 /DNA_START=82 /DNA_END=792 /DNA_ORIENTATION=+
MPMLSTSFCAHPKVCRPSATGPLTVTRSRSRCLATRPQAKSSQQNGVPTLPVVARRRALISLTGATTLLVLPRPSPAGALTEDQWKELVKQGALTKDAYYVLHDSGTERPYTSPLNNEKRVGQYLCAACETELFQSSTKFNSGTGWPSFYDKTKNVELEQDNFFDRVVAQRKEVHCKTCKGHLGHVFEDGWIYPETPTNLRYCINGVSLKFNPDAYQPEPKVTLSEFSVGPIPLQG